MFDKMNLLQEITIGENFTFKGTTYKQIINNNSKENIDDLITHLQRQFLNTREKRLLDRVGH